MSGRHNAPTKPAPVAKAAPATRARTKSMRMGEGSTPTISLDGVGNMATQRLLRENAAHQAPAAEPKLVAADVDEAFERDATRTADAVMTVSNRSEARPALSGPASSHVAAPRAVTRALSEPGRPLDPTTRAFMESRFQVDFSRIRIHANASAATAAATLNARAFAAGPHVVIDPAEHAADRGRWLIAHELSHTLQQRDFGSAGPVIQRQPRRGVGLALPKAEIKAIGNADVNQIIDAFPALLINGQTFTATITTPDGTQHTFGIEITIMPGKPPGSEAARTKKKPMPKDSTAPPTFTIEIFRELPDPTRTLFHEMLHLRLRVDNELPDDQRSQTFARYAQQFQMATDEALLRATGAFDLKKAVMDKIAAVRNWFETMVTGFKTPEAFSAAHDEDFLQHFIEEKFVIQEAGVASISPGRKSPRVSQPVTTETIARRNASIVGEDFKKVASRENLDTAVAAAELKANNSPNLTSLNDLNEQLAKALQKLYDAIDAQLVQINNLKAALGGAALGLAAPPPRRPREKSPREQVDEMLRTQPPLRQKDIDARVGQSKAR